MRRIVTDHEMSRRTAIANAQMSITNAMASHSLTPLEWLQVLSTSQQRMIQIGLSDEWKQEEAEAGKVASDGSGN